MAQARKHEEWIDVKGIIHTIDFAFNMNTFDRSIDLPFDRPPAQPLVGLINTTSTKYRIVSHLFRSLVAINIKCG